jgi:leucyl-tRNA synthetase
MAYPHQKIESKWQQTWDSQQTFKSDNKSSLPKYYILDMFPYPSATGLHVGHPEGYTATDIVSRYKRAQGFNVLHPMGWDAFGLPAEQYAIQTGVHPAKTTASAIENFKRQLKMIGLDFDWTREISTCDPKYYKWTQFIFLKLFEKGLAYQKEVPVNWCPALKTVLANDEVVDGKSERGGHPVVRVPMKQWMLKITDYAERLLNDLDKLDWPERTKEGQRNWIGKSVGARVKFKVSTSDKVIEVFTTRPDTLYGVTFMVLAPENTMVKEITTSSQQSDVENYVMTTSKKSDVDRQASKVKTGVFTGSFAEHPLTSAKIPIWIADYVLNDYGSGAIMAVPGHDSRDFEFAKAFSLEIKQVLKAKDATETELPFEGEGILVNSHSLNGLTKTEAIAKITDELQSKNLGKKEIIYRLRDWLFSRQRYWGEPFPIVHYPKAGLKAVPVNELPVLLPEVANYEPNSEGLSPLAAATDWTQYTDKATGEVGHRITDTMPGAAGSSWYFLRYVDPQNDKEPFSYDLQKYWMPVDLYLGGAEHTVGHLLYSRFWQKVLFDAGLVSHDEPFKKLIHQGMILGPDGEKMSKSRGNVINPDDVIRDFGADSLRIYLMFMGPLDRDKPWATNGIDGVRRFLDRVYRLAIDEHSGQVIAVDKPMNDETKKSLHKTIKKVTEDIEGLNFNTAISQMMIFVNELTKLNEKPKEAVKALAQLLMPFAPHLSEELWSTLGGVGLVSQAKWPKFDASLVSDSTIELGVQVNGKTRGTIELAVNADEKTALELAMKINAVTNALAGKEPTKVIYKPGLILNLIVKG